MPACQNSTASEESSSESGSAINNAQILVKSSPEEVGMSSERLKRLDRMMQDYVDEGKIAGAVGLVARKGKIAHLNAYGFSDIEDAIPMKTDAIFRIASMTKPITSVAVMMLYEQGKFGLNDPVGRYLPELNSMQVIEEGDPADEKPTFVKSKTPITIKHLLTHTSGITYRFLSQWSGDPL